MLIVSHLGLDKAVGALFKRPNHQLVIIIVIEYSLRWSDSQ